MGLAGWGVFWWFFVEFYEFCESGPIMLQDLAGVGGQPKGRPAAPINLCSNYVFHDFLLGLAGWLTGLAGWL